MRDGKFRIRNIKDLCDNEKTNKILSFHSVLEVLSHPTKLLGTCRTTVET